MVEPRRWSVATVALPALVALAIGAGIAVLPTSGAQLTALGAVLLGVATTVLALARRTLNAVWVIVVALLLIDPLGLVATQLALPISIVLVISGLPVPFALIGLWQDATARVRLARIAPLVALVALAAVSLVWSADAVDGFRKLGLWVLLGVVPAGAILILASPARPPAWPTLVLAAGAFAVALLLFGTTDIYPGRLTFEGGNPIWMARATFLGALVAAFAPGHRAVRAAALVPLLVAGLMTNSLGPTLGLVLGAGAGAFEAIRIAPARGGRTWLRLSALGVVVAMGTALALAVVADTPEHLTPLFEDPNVTSRAQYLGAAMDMFLSAPLLGAGFGGFSSLGLADTYPHNIFFEIGAELGVLGLALLVTWLVAAFRAAARSPVLVALLVATTVYALFSGNVSGNTELWTISALCIALAGRGRSIAGGVTIAPAPAEPAPSLPVRPTQERGAGLP